MRTNEERQRDAERIEREAEESGVELSERGGIEPLVGPGEDMIGRRIDG
jgi:hypothetical protein